MIRITLRSAWRRGRDGRLSVSTDQGSRGVGTPASVKGSSGNLGLKES